MTMNGEQLRADFDTWLEGTIYSDDSETFHTDLWNAYQAGRASLQHSCKETSQDREDAERLEWLVEAMGRLDMDEGHRGWFILERDTSRYVAEDCKTFREAIDHARRVEEDGNRCS